MALRYRRNRYQSSRTFIMTLGFVAEHYYDTDGLEPHVEVPATTIWQAIFQKTGVFRCAREVSRRRPWHCKPVYVAYAVF